MCPPSSLALKPNGFGLPPSLPALLIVSLEKPTRIFLETTLLPTNRHWHTSEPLASFWKTNNRKCRWGVVNLQRYGSPGSRFHGCPILHVRGPGLGRCAPPD